MHTHGICHSIAFPTQPLHFGIFRPSTKYERRAVEINEGPIQPKFPQKTNGILLQNVLLRGLPDGQKKLLLIASQLLDDKVRLKIQPSTDSKHSSLMSQYKTWKSAHARMEIALQSNSLEAKGSREIIIQLSKISARKSKPLSFKADLQRTGLDWQVTNPTFSSPKAEAILLRQLNALTDSLRKKD